MEIVNFQKKVFQLPRDIQTIIREYGVVQVRLRQGQELFILASAHQLLLHVLGLHRVKDF